MCLGIPFKIEKIEGNSAIGSVSGIKREIDIRILDDVNINDYVLVHAGFAIQKVDEFEAKETLDILREYAKSGF
ncbi:MAG: HypC/HybG/HupF family hydrogenase formation chaperone [Candidatus Cloacimonadota bacterium]|nr:MAG: HypC/HybG/HupF family hydrogenase formation chaperone [Candidatus Cloacimonadota bacterium]